MHICLTGIAEADWALFIRRILAFVILTAPAALLTEEVCASLTVETNILEIESRATANLSLTLGGGKSFLDQITSLLRGGKIEWRVTTSILHAQITTARQEALQHL